MRNSVRDHLMAIIDLAEARLRTENGPLDPNVAHDLSQISISARDALDMVAGPYPAVVTSEPSALGHEPDGIVG